MDSQLISERVLPKLDQAEIEQGTTKKRCLRRLVFLDQFFARNKNFLGKKPKSWTHPLKTGFLRGGVYFFGNTL